MYNFLVNDSLLKKSGVPRFVNSDEKNIKGNKDGSTDRVNMFNPFTVD